MWPQLILMVISMAISYVCRPKPQNAKPPTIGDYNVPTAEDGKVLGVLFGTKKIEDPNCVWWGDVRTTPIKKRA